jgi:mannosyl-oligosaccharide alpha-1,2-mannosidase
MGHLACFVPGMLALGAASGVLDSDTAKVHLVLAEELGSTCYRLYESQPTGIGPENVAFNQGVASAQDRRYINRPETTEGIFYLWRVTKKQQYREWGWKIFLAMERHCRAELGYTGLEDVTRVGGGQIDKMESFFIAETLKYLYLLQSSDETLLLAGIDDDFGKKKGDFFVFNTEAHPLRAWDDDQPLNRRL